ncbi:MAG TPA: hypothetical protein VFU21_17265 [Kofleriaceae bacterium]|nr:hypothetical protein [Kofleriaceae bacterium]
MTWLALAILVACGDDERGRPPDGGSPARCIPDECAPFACDPRGACFRSCRGEAECAAEHVCQDGACVGTECTPESAFEECGPYACLNGNCAPDCALGPCAEGYYCHGNENECLPLCTSPDDPVCEGYRCDVEVGECEPYCDDQLPCATGYTCVGLECRPEA